METVKSEPLPRPVAASRVAAEPPDGGSRPSLVARLAGWCTSSQRAQDRDPTLWMHRDVTA